MGENPKYTKSILQAHHSQEDPKNKGENNLPTLSKVLKQPYAAAEISKIQYNL